MPVAAPSRRFALPSLGRAVWPFAVYALVSFVYFGRAVAAHPDARYVGQGADPEIFVWAFAWWPHAILHGQNPLVTHVLWAPTGLDLAWTASAPALAIAFAPLTLLAGPVVAFNVAAVLMPAAAAYTAFLLCRHVTHATLPSLVGGYVFGFSSYMLGQQFGHMHMTSVFLLPLIALVVLRAVEGSLGTRRFVAILGAILGLQIWLSTEIFFTATLALVVCVGLAFAFAREARARLRGLLLPGLGAYGVAAAIGSPILAYALTDFQNHSINNPDDWPADLLNFVVPTNLILLSGHPAYLIARDFAGNLSENGAYVGIPALVVAGWYARRRWRDPGARILLLGAAITALAALGTGLRIRGRAIESFPWKLVAGLPGFNNVLPVRLSVYLSLALAVIVASWGSTLGINRLVRIGLLAAVVVSLVPDPRLHSWWTTPYVPRFIADETYRRCLAKGENLVPLPYGAQGDAILWQAKSGFWFRMAAGYLTPEPPPPFDRWTGVVDLMRDVPPADGASSIVAIARRTGSHTILVDARHARKWRPVLDAPLGAPREIGGVLLYKVDREPHPC